MKQKLADMSDALDRICQKAAIGFFFFMVVLILFQVVGRYIFQAVPAWTAEAARYCMIWGGLLGATSAFKTNADPRLFQPPATRIKWINITATALRTISTIIFLAPVLYYCDTYLVRTFHRTTPTLEIRTIWVSIAIPLFILIIFFHMACDLICGDASKKSNGYS
ncbi:MAG: TRAP transporter small permease subunit [Desulfobacteraceae bacterium]|nr:TRAP transporter small permease subunit [Desulfobacteraceae bacterium]